jgi:hypothetical protein
LLTLQTDTKAKPYVCPVCSKGFARIDLLKRHVTNHDSESATKRQRREIARDTRVVQACETCSQSHLRCEDEKPCSRCRKKGILCRVPEDPVPVELNELDAVHAAQDLLDLSNGCDSNGCDFPTSLSNRQGDDHLSLTAKFDQFGSSSGNGHSLVTPETMGETMNGSMNAPAAPRLRVLERSTTVSSHIPSATTMLAAHSHYADESGQTVAFFDNHISHFSETPRIDPLLPDYFRNMPPMDSFFSGQATPRGIMDLSFDLDVGLTDLDLGLLDQYNFQVPFAVDTPSTDTQDHDQQLPESESVPVRTEAFKQSIWRYLPQSNRDYGGSEQVNLAFLDSEKDSRRRSNMTRRRAITERLHRVSRDRLMALVLGTCSQENVRRISSAFPSIELLDTLIQFFLTSPSLDAQSWFHLPTFSPSKISPELLAGIVSAGAASTPDTPLRKLGFALHEASRIGQAKAFEADNSAIRELHHLQTLLLQLQVGMWSGISRKMEIAESFLQPLVTMLRRGGRFRNSTWREILPTLEDQGTELEEKWHNWVQQESYLRLMYRTFELDRQSSMALLKPPLISYSEMQLPLQSPNFLWRAHTATDWKTAYLSSSHEITKRPSALETFLDLERIAQYDSASTTYLHMVYGMVWEFRQMSALTIRAQLKTNNNLILSSRHQELTQQLEDFRVSSPYLCRSSEIALELMLVHLNAPLDEIQLFAGLEGQEEARNAYPALREWTKSAAARQSLWHAGQILRAIAGLPKGLLCNFNAIALYHAGLILWGYGFIKRSAMDEAHHSSNPQVEVVLNGDEALSAQKFITLNRGIPTISSPRSQANIRIRDVSGVMDALVDLLQAPYDATEGSCPPLVGNLVQLLEGLRAATR